MVEKEKKKESKKSKWDYSRDLLLAKKGELYHKKLMEFHKEHMKQIEEVIKKQGKK